MNENEEFQVDITESLKYKMKKGGVHFTYVKKDGTERKAYGTRWGKMIEEKAGESALPKDHLGDLMYREKTGLVTYFDLDKLA